MVNYGLLMAMGYYGGWSVVGLAAKECERGERHGRRAASSWAAGGRPSAMVGRSS